MTRARMAVSFLVAGALAGAACARTNRPGLPAIGPVTALSGPAGPGSGEPFVSATPDGSFLLSWMEPQGEGHALRYARLRGDVWTEGGTIAESATFFVNWADFPSILELADGRLAAHWLARSGPGKFAYDVMLSVSQPGGVDWSEPVRPHRDGTETEHGFVTLFELDGALAAVWLDGRKSAAALPESGEAHGAEMTLRFTTLGPAGHGEEQVVDDRTCDCCQTDVALTAEGPVLVYRDRSPEEIRDIAASRFAGGRWTEPIRVHADDWEIAGCPVNGPAIAARERDVVVAWYTAARDTARVHVAFSRDAGAVFQSPVRVDRGDPVGRVDAILLDDGTALVTWLERVPEGARVLARRVAPDGRTSGITEIGGTTADRPAGFPRMARSADRVLFAWTVPGEPAEIRVASAPLR
jgi:hypothetical protein